MIEPSESQEQPDGAGAQPAGNTTAPDAAAELTAKLAAAEAEIAAQKDKLLRALAEQENQRRRFEREREDTAKYAIARFARDLLTVADNLQRALEADGAAGAETADAPRTGIAAGVAATERELMAAFERHGVRRIDPKGQKFDPHFHQAVFEVPDAGNPPGTVVNVAAPGYVIGDRLLRAAMVGVAKPAPGAEPPQQHIDTKA